MAWIQWGEGLEVSIAMLKDHVQDHENLLKGNADENVIGIVPIVNDFMAKLRLSHDVGKILQGVAIILLMWLAYRTETKPPAVVLQLAPQQQVQPIHDTDRRPAIALPH